MLYQATENNDTVKNVPDAPVPTVFDVVVGSLAVAVRIR